MKNRSKFFAVSALAAAGLLAAPAAFAHTFGAHAAGFAEGMVHPFLGLDHLLAMLAVGLWAGRLGGAALWRVPTAFLSAMAAGAGLAGLGLGVAGVELGVAASVLALGLLLVFAPRWSSRAAALTVGFFALFHGYAHGLEMPQAAAPDAYGLGFLAATACLHGLGLGLGWAMQRLDWAARMGGAVIAATGLLLLTA